MGVCNEACGQGEGRGFWLGPHFRVLRFMPSIKALPVGGGQGLLLSFFFFLIWKLKEIIHIWGNIRHYYMLSITAILIDATSKVKYHFDCVSLYSHS